MKCPICNNRIGSVDSCRWCIGSADPFVLIRVLRRELTAAQMSIAEMREKLADIESRVPPRFRLVRSDEFATALAHGDHSDDAK